MEAALQQELGVNRQMKGPLQDRRHFIQFLFQIGRYLPVPAPIHEP
jgi:hypothetical protein